MAETNIPMAEGYASQQPLEIHPSEGQLLNVNVPNSNAGSAKLSQAKALREFGKSFGRAFGEIKEDRDRIARAEAIVEKEQITQAKIEGRAASKGGNAEFNLNEMIEKFADARKWRKNLEVKLFVAYQEGFHLRQGEKTLADRNSSIKINARKLVDVIYRKFIKDRAFYLKEGLSNHPDDQVTKDEMRSGTLQSQINALDNFAEYASQYIEADRAQKIKDLVAYNPYMLKVFGHKGSNLNYEPLEKLIADKVHEEQTIKINKTIQSELAIKNYTDINEYRSYQRSTLQKFPTLTRDHIDSLFLYSIKQRAIEAGNIENPNKRRAAQRKAYENGINLLTTRSKEDEPNEKRQNADGITTLEGSGNFSILEIGNKPLRDAALAWATTAFNEIDKLDAIDDEKSKDARKTTINFQKAKASGRYFNLFDQIGKCTSDTCLNSIATEIKKEGQTDIFMYGTSGGEFISDLGKELTRMRGVIIARGLKPPELTPDQRDQVNETKLELTETGIDIGLYNEDQLQELGRLVDITFNNFKKKDWHVTAGPNYKEWEGLSKAYFDVRKKIDDRKLKLRNERKAKDEKLKKEKTTKTTQIEETRKVDESEKVRVELRNTTHKTISKYLKEKNYTGITELIYNTKHNAYKSYNKDGHFGGRLEGEKPIFTNAEIQTYERLMKEDKEHNTTVPLPADNEIVLADLSRQVLELINVVDETELVTKDGTPTGKIQELRIAISNAYTGIPKGRPGKKFNQREITKASFIHLNNQLNGAENDVKNVLDRSHGKEAVFKNAERNVALSLQATVNDRFEISGFPNPSSAKLFVKIKNDLQLFLSEATEKHPEVFERVNFANKDLRMLIFNAHWNSQLVKNNKEIVEGAVNSITDAQKQQGWEEIIRSLVPIGTGKFQKEYEGIGGKDDTVLSESPPVITEDGENPQSRIVNTSKRIENRLTQFADKTSTIKKQETVKNLGRDIGGKTLKVSPMLSEPGETQIIDSGDSLILHVYSDLTDEHGNYIYDEEDPQEMINPADQTIKQ